MRKRKLGGTFLAAATIAVCLAPCAGANDNPITPKVAAACGLYAYGAHITEVYDGDTVTADVDLGFKVWRKDEKLRLHRIDAPEMRGSEREAGIVSRDALRERVLDRDVIICTFKDTTGKYGRYLADIWLGDENINDWLMAEGFAVPYGKPAQADMTGLGIYPRFVPALLPKP